MLSDYFRKSHATTTLLPTAPSLGVWVSHLLVLTGLGVIPTSSLVSGSTLLSYPDHNDLRNSALHLDPRPIPLPPMLFTVGITYLTIYVPHPIPVSAPLEVF